jgi:hypothetical protein
MIVSHTMMMEGDLQAVVRIIRLTRELDRRPSGSQRRCSYS